MTMITPSYLGETIEYSSLHACRSTLEDPTGCKRRSAVSRTRRSPPTPRRCSSDSRSCRPRRWNWSVCFIAGASSRRRRRPNLRPRGCVRLPSSPRGNEWTTGQIESGPEPRHVIARGGNTRGARHHGFASLRSAIRVRSHAVRTPAHATRCEFYASRTRNTDLNLTV